MCRRGTVGEKRYQINREGFQAVAISPDGKYIVPENVSPENDKLLKIMKQRDSYPAGSAEYVRLHAEATAIFGALPVEEQKVNPKKPYTFYVLGGDVTEKLNENMRQIDFDYAYMHEKYWVENLIEFMELVRGNSIMDLKNQPEWEHSAFIYNGEIIDQDVPGNINYGYFGTHCNIPPAMLMLGAGYAQWRAGNADIAFFLTLFDDPRDTNRVFQGIDIYAAWH